MHLDDYFKALWKGYTEVTKQAQKIYDKVCECNGEVFNDHVAFRTFNISPLNIESIEPSFIKMGYVPFDDYQFPVKKLRARAYIHRSAEHQPKIFMSELLVDELSCKSQAIIRNIIANADIPDTVDETLFLRGTIWPTVSWADYQCLLAESEYAAWLSVMGFRANHFTIYLNSLSKHHSLDELIELVQSLGLSMNESGGLIKGNALVGLQQASTLADEIEYQFSDDDQHVVKSCYYEFALRYPDKSGKLYQGFVADSADKIFESTHQKLASG